MSDIGTLAGVAGLFQKHARMTSEAGKVNQATRKAIEQRKQEEERRRTHPIVMAINANKHYQPKWQGEQTEEEQREAYNQAQPKLESNEKRVDYSV